MGKCKRRVRCTMCTKHRWKGNNQGRFSTKDTDLRRQAIKAGKYVRLEDLEG